MNFKQFKHKKEIFFGTAVIWQTTCKESLKAARVGQLLKKAEKCVVQKEQYSSREKEKFLSQTKKLHNLCDHATGPTTLDDIPHWGGFVGCCKCLAECNSGSQMGSFGVVLPTNPWSDAGPRPYCSHRVGFFWCELFWFGFEKFWKGGKFLRFWKLSFETGDKTEKKQLIKKCLKSNMLMMKRKMVKRDSWNKLSLLIVPCRSCTRSGHCCSWCCQKRPNKAQVLPKEEKLAAWKSAIEGKKQFFGINVPDAQLCFEKS